MMIVQLILVVRLILVARLIKVVFASRIIDVGVVLHRTRGDVLCSGQWIRSGLEQRGRGRRGRARDNDLHRVMLGLDGEMGDAEVHTEPPIDIREPHARAVDSIETKGHAASDHIDEDAKHDRLVAPRPTVVAERFDPQMGTIHLYEAQLRVILRVVRLMTLVRVHLKSQKLLAKLTWDLVLPTVNGTQ